MSCSRILLWPKPSREQEKERSMAESQSPGPGRSTSNAAFGEIKKEIARRNEEFQKAARKVRTAREKEQVAQRRKWERL
jgi:hypothetical protein